MTGDKELLFRAARACNLQHVLSGGQIWITMKGSIHQYTERWNPLENDGQALRLAVDLGIGLLVCLGDDARAECMTDGENNFVDEAARHNDGDLHRAARRAIVRAAAELEPAVRFVERM